MSDDVAGRAGAKAAVLLFGAIALLIALDLLSDYREGASAAHLGLELTVMLLAVYGAVRGFGRLQRTRAALHATRSSLATARAQAAHWQQENQALIRGLGYAIDRQFRSWSLSPAEAQVGLLLLKGLSLREIADARGTSERTVREQARALYGKAGLSGRAALSAFFLEDLLLPAAGNDA